MHFATAAIVAVAVAFASANATTLTERQATCNVCAQLGFYGLGTVATIPCPVGTCYPCHFYGFSVLNMTAALNIGVSTLIMPVVFDILILSLRLATRILRLSRQSDTVCPQQ